MKFSRKATREDFDNALEEYVLHLSYDIREQIKNGASKKAKHQIVREMGISSQEARTIINACLGYWAALKDFHDGKEVFVEY